MGHTGLIKQITNNKQALFGLFVVAVTIFSTFYAAIASAETLQSRSITPSTASISAEADSVSYQVAFTPEENAGAIVLDFCNNTPLIGQSCTPPVGMDLAGAASADATVASATANKVVLTGTFEDGVEEIITLTGLTNPTVANPVFVRMLTYVDGTAAGLYESDDQLNADGDPGGAIAVIDSGSITMLFNTDINVSGTVLETMTFCVSGTIINPDCDGLTAAAIKLGDPDAGLVVGEVSTGVLHTQMNTNASRGAVVRLKSSATCGGLMRVGTTECNIAAALGTNVVDNDNSAKFGLKLAAVTTAPGALNPIGTLVPYDADGAEPTLSAFYDTTNYKFNFVDDETGVTSVFGDPIIGTNSAPATNQNMALEFAASIGTNTPAGTYSTDLSLIAVGTF